MLKVTLPSGDILDAADGATVADLAAMIGPGLARVAIAGRVTQNGTGETIDLAASLRGDCDLAILTASDDDPESLLVLRHSCAHVMAEAICTLFPDAKLVYGPPLEDGFYYDIDLSRSLTPDDFPRIEAEMARIIKEKRPFSRHDVPRGDAMTSLRDEGNRYKIDNAERAEGETLSFYVTGAERGKHFEDLCRGPHVPGTDLIKAFQISQVSRSHYRGDVNDQPLQRVYGTAFFKKKSLAAHLQQLEEAKKRDHRVLGKELDLFTISDRVGSGLVLWMPKGTIIRNQLQSHLTGEMLKLGYELVHTPHIGQLGLYRTSGHYPYYEESQFPAMYESGRGKAIQSVLQLARGFSGGGGLEQEEQAASLRPLLRAIQETWGKIEGLTDTSSPAKLVEALYAALESEQGYLLKPMNCPHHVQIYACRPRSYRDLPIRLAEFGVVYRFEQSGELCGMTRVRGFTCDDAHLFCTADQLATEVLATVKLTRDVLETLGLGDYRVRLGMRDASKDKWIGSIDNWNRAENAIRSAAVESGVEFIEEAGEAAFYGPKIDFIVKDCIGRSWQLGTVQVDYNLPERFKLTYVGSDNTQHVPIMIHRAPFGSMERFVGILIEHFAGAFPLWLSPVQVGVATVSRKSQNYGRQVYAALKDAGLRVEQDQGDEQIGPKKHRFRAAKVNYILVVGEKEAAQKTVNVNDRDGRTIGDMTLDALVKACLLEIETKGRSRVAAL